MAVADATAAVVAVVVLVVWAAAAAESRRLSAGPSAVVGDLRPRPLQQATHTLLLQSHVA